LQGLIGRKVANRQADSTLDLATIVLEEANVAFVPGEAFGAPGYARFSFALGIDDLVEGINRVSELVEG
jgi:aspartate/methionine/tyrosine aminotransferase